MKRHLLVRSVLAFVVLSASVMIFGCGDDDDSADTGGTYCCMLRDLGTHCNTSVSSESLKEEANKWLSTGNSHNADACKALVDSDTLGCHGGGVEGRDEGDAAAACASSN